MTSRRVAGFTLIELMMVVAIVSLLAAIALPKFGNMVLKSKEAATRGRMGSVRSALAIYYADNEGVYPLSPDSTLARGLVPRYISEIPVLQFPTVPSHTPGNVESVSTFSVDSSFVPVLGGHQVYVSRAFTSGRLTGKVEFACTHPDSFGRLWSTQ